MVKRSREKLLTVGVDGEEGPPVPIPNTVVKLFCAEDTWRAAARENKAMPTQTMQPLNRVVVFIYKSLKRRVTEQVQ